MLLARRMGPALRQGLALLKKIGRLRYYLSLRSARAAETTHLVTEAGPSSGTAIGPRARCILANLILGGAGLSACSAPPPESLSDNNPSRYTTAQNIVYASPQGFDLTMDIYTPTSNQGPYPVIVMFHGGGWLINNKSIMHQAAKYLATNSQYVVCNVNYRLLADSNNTVTLNQIIEDAFGAVLWVQENIHQYEGDGGRVAVTGDSAGAHLAAMVVNAGHQLHRDGFAGDPLGFNPSYLPTATTLKSLIQKGGIKVQAAVLSYGAYDLYAGARGGFEKISNPFWLMSGSLPRGIFGPDYNVTDHAARYRAVSPRYNLPSAAQRRLPPQLLTAGSEDSLVTPASVKAYQTLLDEAGHVTQYWEHEGRPHAYLDSGSNALLGISFAADAPPALDVMIEFFDSVFYHTD